MENMRRKKVKPVILDDWKKILLKNKCKTNVDWINGMGCMNECKTNVDWINGKKILRLKCKTNAYLINGKRF